jgi:hypothetical protein
MIGNNDVLPFRYLQDKHDIVLIYFAYYQGAATTNVPNFQTLGCLLFSLIFDVQLLIFFKIT